MILLGLILVVTIALLVTQAVRVELVALGVVATLGLTGLLAPQEALAGFSNSATLTVAAMLVLSAGLERTGVVDAIGAALVRYGGGRPTRLLVLIAIPTAVFSAFMNNTAIVALMIPVSLTLARRTDLHTSKLLIPISYISILAGTCTLIGTSTNILVDSLYREAGGPGFGMFEFGPLGLLYLIVGGAYVLLLVPRLLPERSPLAQFVAEAPGQFMTEVTVPKESRLVGQPLASAFGEDKEIRVLELIRDEEVTLGPAPTSILRAGDVLLVEGTARTIHEMTEQQRLVQGTEASRSQPATIKQMDLRIVEAVVTPNSRFQHRRIRDLGLSRRQGIQILALRRLGRHHQYKLRNFRVHSGDVLLLQGEDTALRDLQEEGEVLLIKGVERTLTFSRRAPISVGILLAVVALAAFDVAPIVVLALGGVVAMVATGCLTFGHVTRALDPAVLLLIAGMIPLGVAMEKTGMARHIAEAVVAFAGPFGPVFLIGAFYLLTSLLTEVLSNNAAAVLLTPICLGVATQAGIDPKPLLVAITFGASASFATPIGYQTNTMVMGPGGYTFRDYLRVGLPLNILTWLVATLLIPVFWVP